MKVLLQVDSIEKSHGSAAVLRGATAAFGDRMKVGMIGRNGAGKSTLCRILTGEEEPDGGAVIRGRDLRLGYLEQHDPWEPEETVLGFLARHTGAEEWRCGKVAGRFGLRNEVLGSAIAALSGGFRTRVKLAAMTIPEPNFLVLDEPTNFLDLSTLLLLQDFLADFPGGALLVSHDREFLKRTCDHTLEVERGELTLYPGPLEEYLAFKEEREAHARRQNAAVTAKREQLQSFIDRFRAKNTKASQAKSKMKEMARLRTIAIEHPLPTARIRIPPVEPRKGIAFDCEELEIGYRGRRVASGIHLTIDRGAKVAVVGDNGQGKTTLLRTLAGDLAPRGGRVRRGHGVEVSYYAQHVYESLDPRDTVLSHLERGTPLEVSRQDVLDMAGCFLFHGEAVEKPVAVLSGGERARLCLAGLLLRTRPVLLLDEPTNHLDFETVEALGAALRRFDGTALFISHDRTFVHMAATEILEVGAGRVHRRAGEYGDYVEELERRARASAAGADGPAATAAGERKTRGAEAFEDRKRLRAERARAKGDLERAERRLAALEREKRGLFRAIEGNPADPDPERYRRLHEVERLLEEAEEAWLAASSRVEALGREG